jgi:hypothetical protein
MHRMHRLILIFSVLALAATQPAVAQFEVAPDHFDLSAKAQTAQFAREEQKLRESIAEEQAVLEGYAIRLLEKEQQVEGLRQAAISAGINGDGAGMNIAFLRGEEQELQALRASLAPLVEFSREVLAGLHNDLDSLQEGASSLAARARRSPKTLQASARTGR